MNTDKFYVKNIESILAIQFYVHAIVQGYNRKEWTV